VIELQSYDSLKDAFLKEIYCDFMSDSLCWISPPSRLSKKKW
jgi:hypothetical protein